MTTLGSIFAQAYDTAQSAGNMQLMIIGQSKHLK